MTEAVIGCRVDGCAREHKGRGYCNMHYQRVRRYGSLDGRGSADAIYASRGKPHEWLRQHQKFAGSECLIWPFSTNASGYGQVSGVDKVPKLAHRVMCTMAHGDPPFEHAEAAHSCGGGHNGCVNPNHLSWKDHAGNMADMVAHDRSLQGERNHFAKLTEADVLQIRGDSRTQAVIARDYGVSRANISAIRSGKSWAHLIAPGISPDPHKTRWAD